MNNTRKYVTKIFDDSTHALNVSFYIMRVILFCHFIGVNCISYMALDPMSHESDLLIYPSALVLNIICTIR